MRSFLTEHSLLSRYSATSRITSSSTGMPNGMLATPSTTRTDVFSFPKMLSNPIHSYDYARSLRGNLLDDSIGLHNRHARCVRRAVLGLQFDLRRSILHLRPLLSKVKLRQSRLERQRSRRQQCPTQNDRRREGEFGRSAHRDDMLRVLNDRKRGRIFPR